MATSTATGSTSQVPPKGASSAGSKPSSIKYQYMFEKDRSPTKQLDAILRAIARHIVCEIGDKAECKLTPKKLAAFYKAVGGDYDTVFVQMDHQSISWMWQVTGCQHSLEPTDNDFAPPSIPALTQRGFSRWEALEILLGPEEHVPFLQYTVKHWKLKHPDTGEDFPPDLPRDVFPLVADPDVDRWHETCADKLWEEAEAKDQPPPKEEAPQPTNTKSAPEPAEPKYAYVPPGGPFQSSTRQPPRPEARPDIRPEVRSDGRPVRPRPVSYVHVAGRPQGSNHSAQRATARSPEREYREPPLDDRGRRRSFPDYPPQSADREPPPHSYSAPYLDPNPKRPAPQGRRHSRSRNYSSDSSDDEPDTPPVRRSNHRSPPPGGSRRFAPPTAPQPPPAVNNGARPHRADLRESGPKRRSENSPLGSLRSKVSDKVSGLFGSGRPERPRTDSSRQSSYVGSPRTRRSPQRAPPPRGAPMPASVESDSDDLFDPDTSEDEIRRRRRMREDRERSYYRGRGRDYELDRELDDDVDLGSRRNRHYLRRPDTYRRTSSHADIDRRREQGAVFDLRERDRVRDDRRRFERRSPEDRGSPGPLTGATGRRYPEGL